MRENQNETGGRGSKKAVASNTRHVLVPSFFPMETYCWIEVCSADRALR